MRTISSGLLRQRAKEVVAEVAALMNVISSPCALARPTTAFPYILRSPVSASSFLPPSSPAAAATMSSANITTSASEAAIYDLESIFKQKRLVRSRVRKSLKEMDPSLRSLQDDAIQRIVLEAPWFKSSKRLCAYISCKPLREVDTSKVLTAVLQNMAADSEEYGAKKLYVPRVEDKNSHMRMFNISSTEDLIPNSMNILEPSPVDRHGNQREDVMHASEPVDLLLLPGLAFDKSGRRLGRGGGYYDTFLRNYKKLADERNWSQPLLVALSYSVQILDEEVIPLTPNDVFIDALVSPSGVIPISPAAQRRLEQR